MPTQVKYLIEIILGGLRYKALYPDLWYEPLRIEEDVVQIRIQCVALARDAAEVGMVAALARHDRITAAHLLETDAARTGLKTSEKGLRKEDGSFDGLLLVEGLDAAAVRAALAAVAPDTDPSLYAMVFALEGGRWPRD